MKKDKCKGCPYSIILLAIKIIKNKLMYEIEPFDFMDYDTYEDYYQNYFEQRYEDENDKFFKEKDKYYIKTKYAGVVETTKEYWERCFGEVRG